MSEENKITESGINQDKYSTLPYTDLDEIRKLEDRLTPWHIDASFKVLHIVSHMSTKEKVQELDKIADAFNEGNPDPMPVDVFASMLKVARTIVNNPMPMSISKHAFVLINIYSIVHEAMELDSVKEIKDKISEVAKIMEEMFHEQEPEETPPEAIEAFKKEMEKQGLNVEPVKGSVVKVQKKDGE